jgi:CheY-like chemotaxis protein
MSQELTKHILIVDDQRSAARALRKRLAAVDPNFSVIDVPSGEEALLEIQQRDFDLVISDWRLSGMSGAEFMHRALRRRKELRFFVLTGYSMDEVQEAFAEQEVLGFFEKPVDLPALVDAASKLLLGQAAPAVAPAEEPLPEPVVEAPPEPVPEPAVEAPPEPVAEPGIDQATLIAALLTEIQAEMGASAVALADQEGRILARPAAPNPPQHFDDLVYRLAVGPDESAALLAALGDTPLDSITYHAGAASDLFALSVSQGEERYTLVAALRAGAGRPPGEVVDILHRVGQEELTVLFGLEEDAAQTPAPTEAPLGDEPPMEGEADSFSPQESEDSPDREVEYVPPFIDLDLENIDSQLDTGALDSFWEEEASRETLNSDVLSMDEAIELGLFPGDLPDEDE